ncbi:unnamed protein product [marine sediment metagenome]|uniref:Uncharacterized protein n=1 Tax=marine sediment metagenome TaxID=412755 RepID=X1LHU5_9ZZZZ
MDKIHCVKCFLCGEWIPIRKSKLNRPYLVCRTCAMTIFVNSEKGVRSLKELTQKIDSKKVHF